MSIFLYVKHNTTKSRQIIFTSTYNTAVTIFLKAVFASVKPNISVSLFFFLIYWYNLTLATPTVWFTPHMKTDSSGSLALNNFSFGATALICFLFVDDKFIFTILHFTG